MERLNLTLDPGTSEALTKHARTAGRPRATFARELLREAITRRESLETQRKLARDYAAGRDDAQELLAELELAQLELLSNDEA